MIAVPPWLRALIVSSVRGNLHKFEGTRSLGIVEHFAAFSTLQIACEAIARDRAIYASHKQTQRQTADSRAQREITKRTKALAILLAEGTAGELPEELESEIREVIRRSQIRANFSGLP